MYEENGKQWSMPPSFEVTFLGIPTMLVRVTYALSITVTKSKLWKTWTKKKTYVIQIHFIPSARLEPNLLVPRYVTPVNYHPKSRPARPINMVGTVFASIKPAPEDWCQITGRMEVRPMSTHKTPIECQVSVLYPGNITAETNLGPRSSYRLSRHLPYRTQSLFICNSSAPWSPSKNSFHLCQAPLYSFHLTAKLVPQLPTVANVMGRCPRSQLFASFLRATFSLKWTE